jgi:hypothetical protein
MRMHRGSLWNELMAYGHAVWRSMPAMRVAPDGRVAGGMKPRRRITSDHAA